MSPLPAYAVAPNDACVSYVDFCKGMAGAAATLETALCGGFADAS